MTDQETYIEKHYGIFIPYDYAREDEPWTLQLYCTMSEPAKKAVRREEVKKAPKFNLQNEADAMKNALKRCHYSRNDNRYKALQRRLQRAFLKLKRET